MTARGPGARGLRRVLGGWAARARARGLAVLPALGAGAGPTPRGATSPRAARAGWRCRAAGGDERGAGTAAARLAEALNANVEAVGGAAAAGGDRPFRVVNFYHLAPLGSPDLELQAHRRYVAEAGLDLRGRIFISEHGINAQLSGPTADALAYAEFVQQREAFRGPGGGPGLTFRAFPAAGHAFPKLVLRKKALVSILRDRALPVTTEEARAWKTDPGEWKRMLERGNALPEGDPGKPVVLDLRNSYEWDAGHFEGADRPEEYNFIQTPTNEVIDKLRERPRDAPVMMYCTGGIRCDIYSTVLREQGFNNLHTLDGGIQHYFEQEGGDGWKGSLYVFDARMAVGPDLAAVDDPTQLECVAGCSICGAKAYPPHINCANVDCNKLALVCPACLEQHKGCCCESCCKNPPRFLRPSKNTGYYEKWSAYADKDDAGARHRMAAGRGDGRSTRKQARRARRLAAATEGGEREAAVPK